MARMPYNINPPPQRQTKAALGPPTPLAPSPSFLVDGAVVRGLVWGDNEMIVMPRTYEDRQDVEDDALWRIDEDGDAHRCWKTTEICQHIENHSRLVR